MSGQLILRRLGTKVRWQQARACTSVAIPNVKTYPMEQMTPEMKDRHHPVTGNRDITGHGLSNEGIYQDDHEWPCSGVRFKANTPEILALREKEAGDWAGLTLEDKKTLYRASFAQTFEEILAPTGENKRHLIVFLFGCLATQVIMWIQEDYILPDPSVRLSDGVMNTHLRTLLLQRKGSMFGISSRYDYSKGEWKPGMQPKGRDEW